MKETMMLELGTRILEIEADHDIGRLARALEAAIADCESIVKFANKYAAADMHVAGQGAQARATLDILTEALGADHVD